MFEGDLMFWGGGIFLLSTGDWDVRAYVASIRGFRDAGVDALLPGHHGLSVDRGQWHLDAALRRIDAGFIPPSMV